MRLTHHINQHGMTVIELMVSLVVIMVILLTFSVIFTHAYTDILVSNAKTTLASRTMHALSFIEHDVRTAREFLETAPSVYNDPYGPTPGAQWNHRGNGSKSRVLLLDQYATTSPSLSPHRLPVYTRGTFACHDIHQKRYNPQLHYLSLYFVKDRTLYRRILTDTTTPLCPGETQAQRQSCPPQLHPASRHHSCQARDEVIATDVEEFIVQYHTQTSPITDAYTKSGAVVDADYITVTLRLTDTTHADTTSLLTQLMTKGND
ncbi:MAG: prepilin-type N-terminal cleavage/methylation domain-containing protein [Candidatus Saccharibacteria bacterium]|nr:prepilin-type N-terminal cleavage/methylation domain-containing protein [Candidatus Saccharibacteria bacterium]